MESLNLSLKISWWIYSPAPCQRLSAALHALLAARISKLYQGGVGHSTIVNNFSGPCLSMRSVSTLLSSLGCELAELQVWNASYRAECATSFWKAALSICLYFLWDTVRLWNGGLLDCSWKCTGKFKWSDNTPCITDRLLMHGSSDLDIRRLTVWPFLWVDILTRAVRNIVGFKHVNKLSSISIRSAIDMKVEITQDYQIPYQGWSQLENIDRWSSTPSWVTYL